MMTDWTALTTLKQHSYEDAIDLASRLRQRSHPASPKIIINSLPPFLNRQMKCLTITELNDVVETILVDTDFHCAQRAMNEYLN